LAIREGFSGEVEHAERHPYHVATHDCACGTGYRIFVGPAHYGMAKQFQNYVKQILEAVHAHNEKHPDVIQIAMDAEFST